MNGSAIKSLALDYLTRLEALGVSDPGIRPLLEDSCEGLRRNLHGLAQAYCHELSRQTLGPYNPTYEQLLHGEADRIQRLALANEGERELLLNLAKKLRNWAQPRVAAAGGRGRREGAATTSEGKIAAAVLDFHEAGEVSGYLNELLPGRPGAPGALGERSTTMTSLLAVIHPALDAYGVAPARVVGALGEVRRRRKRKITNKTGD